MRNKEQFIEDAQKVIKQEWADEERLVEDAAHTLHHTEADRYVVAADYTITGKDESFLFETKKREKTDDSDEDIEDFFYVGKGDGK